MDVSICFNKDDTDFVDLLKYEFGEDINITYSDNLDGKEIFTLIIKITKLTVGFIKNNMNKPEKKRFIRTRSGDIFFENFSSAEISEILEALKNES